MREKERVRSRLGTEPEACHAKVQGKPPRTHHVPTWVTAKWQGKRNPQTDSGKVKRTRDDEPWFKADLRLRGSGRWPADRALRGCLDDRRDPCHR